MLTAIPISAAHVSARTLGEMRRGALMKGVCDPSSAAQFDIWLAHIETTLAGRILPITPGIAFWWGEMTMGRSRPVIDTMIAATASVHGLTIVTRNAGGFRDLDVSVMNPFDA